jgi:hypothetical protein
LVAVIWYENALPAVPPAEVALVITGTGTVIVSVRVALPVPPAFVAPNVTVEVAAAVGVPEISPVEVFTDKPPGKPAALKLVCEFVAVIWYENAVPTVPLAEVALVITGAATAVAGAK